MRYFFKKNQKMDSTMSVRDLLDGMMCKQIVSKGIVKRKKREQPKRVTVRLDDPNYRVYQNIEGMCIPLDFSLDIDNPYNLVREEHFFPYRNVHSGEMGFFLKTIDDKYTIIPQNKLRAILHGKTAQFRPRSEIPATNRISVYDGEYLVEICYWPDRYLRRDCLNRKKKE